MLKVLNCLYINKYFIFPGFEGIKNSFEKYGSLFNVKSLKIMNVWKIASRWSANGNPNSSILDIFRNNNIVFAGRKQDKIRNSIKLNNLIAISDGLTVVSVAKVTSIPKSITEFTINDLDIKSERFDYKDWVIGFKVNLYNLKPNDRFEYRQGTFHGVNEPVKNQIKKLYEEYNQEYSLGSKFSINATTCTLKYNSQTGGNIILNRNKKYIIPIYQRPYSWTEQQIGKFVSDIFRSFYGYNKTTPPEPMFIGTMQLSEEEFVTENETEQKVIDGQQRLTTFLVLLKLLILQYPSNKELNNINLQWLETRVNNGEQNKKLTEFINLDKIEVENSQNKYIQNAIIIKGLLDEELKDEENKNIDFDLDGFLKHLLSNIYFVIIETRAGLSKTLQIFDAINTTGLDLNSGDIFKIRMYEYLTNIKGESEKTFNEISKLYAKIDEKNKEKKCHINILEILDIYKYILIAKYNLPTVLYQYGVATFFDRLFDTIFNINEWLNFKKIKNNENFTLLLDDISQIIDNRFYLEKIGGQTTEDACLMEFIYISRYRRYAILKFVFMYYFKDEENFEQKLFIFIKKLSKLFIIYSIRFKRAINEIHQFNHRLLEKITENSFKEVIEFIDEKIGNNDQHNQDWYNLNHFLTVSLTDNTKRKYIICRLSAMIDENYKSSYNPDILEKIFYTEIDVEHIQAFNDHDKEDRPKIRESWGSEINSIGNLIILERNINRSIGNNPYKEKIKKYKNSSLNVVRNQINNYIEWDLQSCKKRKETELNKIIKYLFNEND